MTSSDRSRHTSLVMTTSFVLRLTVVIAAVLALKCHTAHAREIPQKEVPFNLNQFEDKIVDDEKPEKKINSLSDLPTKVSIPPLDDAVVLTDTAIVKDGKDVSDSDKEKKTLKKTKWAKKKKAKKQKKIRKQNKQWIKKNKKGKKKEMMKKKNNNKKKKWAKKKKAKFSKKNNKKKSGKNEKNESDKKELDDKIRQKMSEMNDFEDIAELFVADDKDGSMFSHSSGSNSKSESESRSTTRKSGSVKSPGSSESEDHDDDDDDVDDDDNEFDPNASGDDADVMSEESSVSKDDGSSFELSPVDDADDDSTSKDGDLEEEETSPKSGMRVRRSAKRRKKGSKSKKKSAKSKHKPKSAHKPKPKSAHKPKPKSAHKPKPKSAHKPKPKSAHKPKPKSAHKPKPKSAHKPKPKSAHKPKPKPAPRPAPKPKSVAKPKPRPAVQPRPLPQRPVQPKPKGTVKKPSPKSHSKKHKSHGHSKMHKSHGHTHKHKSHGHTKKHKSHGHTHKHKSHGHTKKHKSHGHTKKHKSHGHTHKHKSHGHTKKHKSHSPKKATPKPVPQTPKPTSPISKTVRRKIDQGLRWRKNKLNQMCECQASGDPHYRTFDGSMIHFMGTCEYTLVKTLPRKDNCGFEVTVGNEHRYGQTRVSYTRMVRLRMFGIEIVLYKGKRVVINGVRQFPPIYIDKRLSIVQNWRDVTITTQCGVEVSYKDDHMAKVLVPKRFAGQLAGICGNCDGKAWNDFRLSNGSWVVKNVDKDALIGSSYAVETLSDPRQAGCETKKVSIFACPDQFKTAAENACRDIMNNAGPFKDCQKTQRTQARMYYDNCLQDVCAAIGDGVPAQRAVCKSMEAFSDHCLDSGFFSDWRTAERCPLNCPVNSHYSAAVSACPPSCVTPKPKGACTLDLVPGCECNEGYVLDDRLCVPKGRCGCLDDRNDYIPVNTTFRSRDCLQTFRCQVTPDGRSNQIVVVETKACGKYGRCVLKRGVRMCRCRRGYDGDGYDCVRSREERDRQREIFKKQIELRRQRKLEMCECTGSGDPHYRTFDGQMIHFQGSCTYTLSKSVESMRNESCIYDVRVSNEHRNNNNRVAFTRSVSVRVKNVQIDLLHGLKLMVNGKVRYAPVVIPEQDVKIVRSGQMLEVIVSQCSLEVAFDGRHRVDVRVPKVMGRYLNGICGNCNGKQDDFATKDGVDVSKEHDKYSLIGNSYLITDNTMVSTSKAAKCRRNPPPVTCDPESLTLAGSSNHCGRLTDPKGPFAACARAMREAVTEIFESCVLDLCSFVGQSDVVSEVTCMAYETLAGMCEASGISVRWRTSDVCPMPCPANSRYNPLMSGCQSTCLGPAPEICAMNQREGCECEEGFVLDNGRCILPEICGCRDAENAYFPIGSTVTSDDCKTVTSCQATRLGSMLETRVQFPDGCAVGAECASVQGERVCRCKKGFLGDGMECVPGQTTPSAIVAMTEDDMVPQPTVAIQFTPAVVDPTPPPPTPQPPQPTPPLPTPPPPTPAVMPKQTTLAGPAPPQPTPPPAPKEPTPPPPTPQPPTPPPPTPKPVTLPGPVPPQTTPQPPAPSPQQPTPPPPTPPAPTPPPPGPKPLRELPVVVDNYTFVATQQPPQAVAAPCECRATGDPHYRTFDGARLEIYDSCKYIMAETLTSDFPCAFRVEVKNEKRPNSDHPTHSYTRLVDIRLPTDTIRLHRGGKIYFNGEELAPGFTNGKITIIFDGIWTNLTTACGLNVSFDGDKKAVVRMSGNYRGTTKGLCGNCDGNVENDVTVDGRFVFTFDTIMEGYHKLAKQFLIADDSDKPDTSIRCEPPLRPYGYTDKKK